MATGVAIVGCGYVADLYINSFENWRDVLDLRGTYDRNGERLRVFSQFYDLNTYGTLEDVLSDDRVEIVLNLTNPTEHYSVSMACLAAGKHVYSEKPLAVDFAQAQEVLAEAEKRGLHVASAPATVLGEAAQTLWREVRSGTLGQPRLVYAELDDGMVHRIGYENWKTRSGAYWPADDEFATGCTLEHAGYAVTWLTAMFGPARRVVSFAKLLVEDKGRPRDTAPYAPDFSCACLEFDDGVVARITNSILAPHDHRFRVICEDGMLSVEEMWDFNTPVIRKPVLETRLKRQLEKKVGWDGSRRVAPAQRRSFTSASRGYRMDFAAGPAEMAQAIAEGRPPRLGGRYALHTTELALAIQHPERFGTDYTPVTDFPPMMPMPWAKD
ncbi:MAG: Gfo/Idh/MocA family oxidoreductase [Pseudomonadota bacterium]